MIRVVQDNYYGRRLHVLPIDDTIAGITENLFKIYLKPYFCETYRPVKMDDAFIVSSAMHTVAFKAIQIDSTPYYIAVPDTIINCQGDPIKREQTENTINQNVDHTTGGV
ncbi:unnamed protein product [Rotaria magnacalcarata]|uniref:Uncharacterized protein n=1 Tax=Rotaria magnacalcarata TaxID=392030 RepID=A0A816RDR0_9BILA|nr:unnamed protein product [Rotaria magnacalcarata]CAF2084046.1 unnamed protein product [Rotaria magnacalcarata]CAF4208713.1 unnamed protein product [Rotaria magnacalcarata]CAF4238179.1 unnamed protein product [Rotaria magnacalcarata]